jgi:hypothetical protein
MWHSDHFLHKLQSQKTCEDHSCVYRASSSTSENLLGKYFAGTERLETNGPLFAGFELADKKLLNGEKFTFHHKSGFINFAKNSDIVYFQKGRRPRVWIPIMPALEFLKNPFYHLKVEDEIPDFDTDFEYDIYFKATNVAAYVEVDVSSFEDRWANEEIFEPLPQQEFEILKREIQNKKSDKFIWNSHGMWKKGRLLKNGKHRYLGIKLYRIGNGSDTQKDSTYFDEFKQK